MKYRKSLATTVNVVATQDAEILAADELLAETYRIPVRKNTAQISIISAQADTNLTITYRQLHVLGSNVEEIVASTPLRTGAYAALTKGRYEIPITLGANVLELVVTSAAGIRGWLECMWYDTGPQIGSEYLRTVLTDQVVSIPAGQAEILDYYAPANCVSAVCGMRISCPRPSGATSGSHVVQGYYKLPDNNLSAIFSATYGYDEDASLFGNMFEGAPSEVIPPSDIGQIVALQKIVFDAKVALRLYYINKTNVTQTAARRYILVAWDRRVR